MKHPSTTDATRAIAACPGSGGVVTGWNSGAQIGAGFVDLALPFKFSDDSNE